MHASKISHSRRAFSAAFGMALLFTGDANAAKNVIYMVADGQGFNTLAATGYFDVGADGMQLFRGPGWESQAMSVYPLRPGSAANNQPIPAPAGLVQDPSAVYSSASSWDTTPTGSAPLEFQGYAWNNTTAPDSANTISSTVTGIKSYNNSVNVDGTGADLPTFAEIASQSLGMRTGIVSTVQWPDATPAAQSGVSNINRANRTQIADAMLNAPYIDVIMGAGNPDYDNDGVLRAAPNNAWISNSTWGDLKDGDNSGFSADWELHEDKAAFDDLAAGTLTPGKKFLGVVKSFDGKQQYRSADGGLTTNYTTLPNVNKRTDVPELSTMVQGAVGLLEDPSTGFFLGVEQGEVDRAMHSNHLGRTIEAQQEFEAAVAWLDAYLTANAGNPNLANYDNTLVVVTADHDHLLFGPDSNTVPFQEPTNNGAGNLPGALFQTGSHSNQLIPIFAKGSGADLINLYANQNDDYTDGVNTFGRGSYLDQTELFSVFKQSVGVPEPSALALVGLALITSCAMPRRRK